MLTRRFELTREGPADQQIKIASLAQVRVTETRCLLLAVAANSKAPSINPSDPKLKTFGYAAGGKLPQTVPAFNAKDHRRPIPVPHPSALFSHAIRHELYSKLTPIQQRASSAVRECDPDILTIMEMEATIATIELQAIRVMVDGRCDDQNHDGGVPAGEQGAKRTALSPFSGIFVVPKKAS